MTGDITRNTSEEMKPKLQETHSESRILCGQEETHETRGRERNQNYKNCRTRRESFDDTRQHKNRKSSGGLKQQLREDTERDVNNQNRYEATHATRVKEWNQNYNRCRARRESWGSTKKHKKHEWGIIGNCKRYTARCEWFDGARLRAKHEWRNETKTTRDTKRDVNHENDTGNTRNLIWEWNQSLNGTE